MVEATQELAEAIVADSVMATTMAFTGDLAMAGGVILTGGTILTIPTIIHTPIPITIPITMGAMGNRRCLHKGLPLPQNPDNSNLLIGTSVRTQRVTTPTSKNARAVG